MTYNITYICYDCFDNPIKSGTMRVKRCDNKLHAKIKLEGYLKSKHPRCNYIVMTKCEEDVNFFDLFGINM